MNFKDLLRTTTNYGILKLFPINNLNRYKLLYLI